MPFTCRRQSDTATAMTDNNKHSTARKVRTKQKHTPEREDIGGSARALGRYANEGHCGGRISPPFGAGVKHSRDFSFRTVSSCGRSQRRMLGDNGNNVEGDDHSERDVTVGWGMGAARLESKRFRPW